jgi:hypothetical protein
MRQFLGVGSGAALLVGVCLLNGCDVAPRPTAEQPNRSLENPRGQPSDLRQRQVAFLNRIRKADPKGATIDRALLNEQNELGLILDRSVEMNSIPPLMKTMLTQMAGEFPGEDLTVIAYTPSDPPRKIGTAHLDAQSRDMTYTPER